MILYYVFVILCPSSRVTKKSNLPFNLPAVLFNALDILGSVSLACHSGHSGKACLKRHGMLFGSAITAPGGTEFHLSQKWLSDWRPLRTSVCRTPAWRAEPGALSRIWGVHLSTPSPLTLKSPAGSPCQVDVSMAWVPLNVACTIRYIRGIVYTSYWCCFWGLLINIRVSFLYDVFFVKKNHWPTFPGPPGFRIHPWLRFRFWRFVPSTWIQLLRL